jgi:thiosulfate/3-mercaptopyruvate sulfurtransferase
MPRPLVGAEWLRDRLYEPEIVVLDATYYLPWQGRDPAAEYMAGHIASARRFDIDAVADHRNPLPHMLPSPREFAEAAGRLGIGNATRVVIYDANDFVASARVWWTFRVFGHADVAILDGGLARWRQLGFPLEQGVVPAETRTYTSIFNAELVRSLQHMQDLLSARSAEIVDARSPGRFSGREPEPRPNLRAGHMPGAKNLFFQRIVDPATHCLKPPDDIRRELASAEIDAGKPIVATCGTGVTAAVLALAFFSLGKFDVAVYDGSWTEWASRADTPVAQN